MKAIRALLRAVRASLVEAVAATVERVPSLEPWFTRTGRNMARESHIGGGVYWLAQEALMRRLARSGRRYRAVEIRQIPLHVDVTDETGRHPFFYGTPYEKAVTDAIFTALKRGDVFLDIGANIGYFSTLGAKLVGPEGLVVAFEPHEGARGALHAGAELNRVLETIEVVPIALADREGDQTLYTTDAFTSYSTLEPGSSPMRSVATFHPGAVVRVTTLDRWLAGRPELAPRIHCIKIDVEGAEARVLAGMTDTLRALDMTLICETSIGSDADVMLERAGFRRHRIERESQSYGNFLYVRAPAPTPSA